MHWVKLPIPLVWDARFLTVSLAARGLLVSLFMLSGESAQVVAAPHKTLEQTLRVQVPGPSDSELNAALKELEASGLVHRLDQDTLGVTARDLQTPRVGKTSTERSREHRARQRERNTDATLHATQTATQTNATEVQRGCNGDATPDATATEEQTTSKKARATRVQRDATSTEEKREEENRKETPPKSPRGDVAPMPWTVAELTATIHESSGGKVIVAPFVDALAVPLTQVIRQLDAKGVTLADIRLVGEWVKAGGCGWMHDPPGLSWLAKAGSLADAVGKARAWHEAGRKTFGQQEEEDIWAREFPPLTKEQLAQTQKRPTPLEYLKLKGLA